MTLSATTGNPPAVTRKQIEAWFTLADDVRAALTMGGQQGMDILLGIMAEWCEAVDDVNAARQICADFAARGLRHEAINWHAEGFFEVADRLDPNRPGWEAWEQAFRARRVITPRVDPELKEMANRIHEDLTAEDSNGRSLADYLAALRRNMLLRGHLGERLMLLESILAIDPSSDAWKEMIHPIRRKRVDAIGDEVKAAVARRDLDTLAALRAEVASQEWGDGLAAGITTVLDATAHYESLGLLRSRLSQAAAVIVGQVTAARQPSSGPAEAASALAEAVAARKTFAALRTALVEAIRGASSAPEIGAIVTESGVQDAVQRLDASIQEPCSWIAEQEQAARIRTQSAEIEAVLLQHLDSAPAMLANLEVFNFRLTNWIKKVSTAVEKSRKAAARLPGGTPASTEQIFGRLQAKRLQLEAHLQELKRRERRILIYFLIALGVIVALVLGAIFAAYTLK